MNRIVHFEIAADNLEKAAEFYSKVFGWKFEKWSEGAMEYWMVMTAEKDSTEPGINGGMVKRTGKAAAAGSGANAFICTIQVDDFDAAAEKIIAAGGCVAQTKYAIAGMAWQGYFIDPEGNMFGLHQAMKKDGDADVHK